MGKKGITKLYRMLKHKGVLPSETVRLRMSGLYVGDRKEQERRTEAYYVDVFWKVGLVLLVSMVLGLGWMLHGFLSEQDVVFVSRGDYDEEATTVTMEYEKAGQGERGVDVNVPAVRYSEEELPEVFAQTYAYLEGAMLGDNESFEEIRKDMNLIKTIPGCGLAIHWTLSDYTYINERGVVSNEDLEEEEQVTLTLTLSYEAYEESRSYRIRICPRNLTAEELETQQLQRQIEEYIGQRPYDAQIEIPKEFEGVRLTTENPYGKGIYILLLGGIVAALLYLKAGEDLRNQRRKQLDWYGSEFPCLVNRILLYMEAGTTVQGALQSLTKGYEMRGQTKNPIYSELQVMWNEIHTGTACNQAYRNLGRRIGLLPYLKLVSLLERESKHGGSDLLQQLEQEEHLAYEQRKEHARRKGEEAGTKLLLPMIILMAISMLLIMVPAFLGFKI